MGEVIYQIYMADRQQPLQTFHINMLKKWHPPSVPEASAAHFLFVRAVKEEEDLVEQYLPTEKGRQQLDLTHLNDRKREELLQILPHHLFRQTPGRTEVVNHHIDLKNSTPLQQPVYRVPEWLLPILKKELDMMEMGVIKPSVSGVAP